MDESLTATGAVIGAPAYMPRGQAAGEPTTPLVDVYALGAILYHVLAGQAPYSGAGSHALAGQVRAAPPPPIERVARDAPRALHLITTRAMARAPEQRYPSMLEL